MAYRLAITVFVCLLYLPALNKENADSTWAPKISEKYLDSINKEVKTLSQDINKRSQKALVRIQKQEARLQKKLLKLDSLTAHNIFSNSAEKFNQLRES